MIRKVPATMISQHPDNARRPYWHDEEFISTRHETHECFLSFSDLGVSEYKWDWEGKLVDESVVERLLTEHFDFFQENPLGQKKFLTFRLPNPKVETEFRLGRAFMDILSAAGLARQVGLHSPPLFEVILPMTESAQEMIAIQEAFREMAGLKHPLYHWGNGKVKGIEVIPLFEQVGTICRSDQILGEYLRIHKIKFKETISYMRPYLARSDPALNSGLVPTVLAIKIALSRYQDFEKRTGVELYPIIGSGSLPFRGGLSPETIKQFTQEYRGIRTALLQSAFRYDFEKPRVLQAIKELEKELPLGKTASVSFSGEEQLEILIKIFEAYYQQTVETIAPLINQIANFLPKRRERVLHIGLFGYSRGVGKVKLPRAIGFTAALYSLGVPPELIGTGRGLKQAAKLGKLWLLEKTYVGLKTDLIRAGRFLHKEALKKMARQSAGWQKILEDVLEIEKYLGQDLGPVTPAQKEHYEVVDRIQQELADGDSLMADIQRAALLRQSLG